VKKFYFHNLFGLPSFRWFQQGNNPYTGAADWIFKGGYFDRKYSDLPNIYWLGWENWERLEIHPLLSFTQSISSPLLKLFLMFSFSFVSEKVNSFRTKPLHKISSLESGNSAWIYLFILRGRECLKLFTFLMYVRFWVKHSVQTWMNMFQNC